MVYSRYLDPESLHKFLGLHLSASAANYHIIIFLFDTADLQKTIWLLQLSHFYPQTFRQNNRPFMRCLVPLFQSESWCIAFHIKMSFHSHADKTHFHIKGFARGLTLKRRNKTIRKWPIIVSYIL